VLARTLARPRGPIVSESRFTGFSDHAFAAATRITLLCDLFWIQRDPCLSGPRNRIVPCDAKGGSRENICFAKPPGTATVKIPLRWQASLE
jgi:hypothetical protein